MSATSVDILLLFLKKFKKELITRMQDLQITFVFSLHDSRENVEKELNREHETLLNNTEYKLNIFKYRDNFTIMTLNREKETIIFETTSNSTAAVVEQKYKGKKNSIKNCRLF
nr:hypothetical protein [Microctonus hyperodae filamentous virus]